MPDIPSKFQKDPSIIFWVILLTDKQTNKNRQKHYLLGGGKNTELIKYKAISGRMYDYFGFKFCDDGTVYSAENIFCN